MPREHGIEQYGRGLVRSRGWWELKIGYDGWPDRLIIWRPGHHFWVEWKQPDGSLTKAQKVRIPLMCKSGETVLILDARADFREIMEMLA